MWYLAALSLVALYRLRYPSFPIGWHTQPHGQWSFPSGVRKPERESDKSPPPSAHAKNEWSYTSDPPVVLYGRSLKFNICGPDHKMCIYIENGLFP